MIPFIIFVVVGIVLLVKGFQLRSFKRAIENTPTSKVRSIAMGPVELFGRAKSIGAPGKAPFSKKPYTYCHWTIEELRGGKNKHWVVVKRHVTDDPFLLDDGTGTVLVDPTGANVDIPPDTTMEERGIFSSKIPEVYLQAIEREGVSTKSLFGFRKSLRIREYIIEPGDEIYVYGSAMDNPDVEEGSTEKNEEDIMIARGTSIFYISDRKENSSIFRLRWQSALMIAGGIILLLVGIIPTLLFSGIFLLGFSR